MSSPRAPHVRALVERADADTRSPSRSTISCGYTVSTPAGIGAPVMMRMAWPAATMPSNTEPAGRSAITRRARACRRRECRRCQRRIRRRRSCRWAERRTARARLRRARGRAASTTATSSGGAMCVIRSRIRFWPSRTEIMTGIIAPVIVTSTRRLLDSRRRRARRLRALRPREARRSACSPRASGGPTTARPACAARSSTCTCSSSSLYVDRAARARGADRRQADRWRARRRPRRRAPRRSARRSCGSSATRSRCCRSGSASSWRACAPIAVRCTICSRALASNVSRDPCRRPHRARAEPTLLAPKRGPATKDPEGHDIGGPSLEDPQTPERP